jgi:hypothetical protein
MALVEKWVVVFEDLWYLRTGGILTACGRSADGVNNTLKTYTPDSAGSGCPDLWRWPWNGTVRGGTFTQ